MRRITSAVALVLLFSQVTSGHVYAPIQPVPQDEFTPIPNPIPNLIIDDFKVEPKEKPALPNRAVLPKLEPVPTKEPVKKHIAITKTRKSVSGVASWYCKTGVSICTRGHSGGMYAAIRKDLLFLRGRLITVSHGGKSIQVRVIDCNCGPHANLIDLYSDAFKRLDSLGAGRIPVRISW